MTVQDTASKVQYTGDGVFTGPYNFTFQTLEEWIEVFVAGLLISNTLYTLTVNADQDVSPGGNVVFDVAVDDGLSIVILRTAPLTQGSDYEPFDPFPSARVEGDFDKSIIIDQQQQETLDRALVLAVDSTQDTVLPPAVASGYWRWNSSASAIEYAGAPGVIIPELAFGVVSDVIADISLEVGDLLVTYGYTAMGDGGDNSYRVVAGGTGTPDGGQYINLANGLQINGLFPGGVVSIDQFGADKTGTADSFIPIQTALNLGIKLAMSTGVYLTSQSLKWEKGAKLIGKGNWSGIAGKSTNLDLGTTVIRYTGTAGGNTAVCILSAEIVGVEPVDSATRDMQNIGLSNITIDGNLLAGIGVYMVRAFSNNNLDFITVTGTTAHAFLAMTCFNGAIKSWTASQNSGKGITLGQKVFASWDNSVCDQTHFDSLVTLFSGYNNGYLNAFDEATNVVAEYGIGYFGGRGNVFTNAQAFRNGGIGIYLNPQNSPTLFNGGYLEINGESSNSTQSWDIWFFGKDDGSSWDVTFDQLHIGSPGKPRNIRLTGTVPSRKEAGVLFKRMQFINNIDADWGAFRLIDCNRDATFNTTLGFGAEASGFSESLNGDLNLATVGRAFFVADSGAIASLEMNGLVSAVAYAGVGLYDVTLRPGFSDARYTINPGTGDNRIVGSTNITTTGFRLNHRDSSGVLTDAGSRISVSLGGAFS